VLKAISSILKGTSGRISQRNRNKKAIKYLYQLILGIFAHPDKKGDFRNFACYAFLK
jgi:hypothetical protein